MFENVSWAKVFTLFNQVTFNCRARSTLKRGVPLRMRESPKLLPTIHMILLWASTSMTGDV